MVGALIGAGAKAGLGIYQLIKSGKVKPQDLTPEMKERLQGARIAAKGEMPGLGKAKADILGAQAGGVKSIQETGTSNASRLGAIAGLNQNTQSQMSDLGVKDAQFRIGQQDKLSQTLQNVSDKKDQYSDAAAATKSALLGAGIQNISGGLNEGLGIAEMRENSPTQASVATPTQPPNMSNFDFEEYLKKIKTLGGRMY